MFCRDSAPAAYGWFDSQRALVENAAAFHSSRHRRAVDEKTLRKHFRDELNSGKFKVDMTAGKTVTELMESRDERVRLDWFLQGVDLTRGVVKGWAFEAQPGN